MKIAIDSRWIFKKISGVGKYTEILIKALAEIDKENEYFLIFDKQHLLERTAQKLHLAEKKNFKTILVSYSLFSINNQLRLPFKLASLNINIFHSTNFMIPLFTKVKTIVTMHDIILIHSPHFSPLATKSKFFYVYKQLSKFIAHKATLIFTDSYYSQSDIVKHLKVSQDKVKTVYMGIDNRFSPAYNEAEKTQLKAKYQLNNKKIILYVGRQDPYKNLSTLIQAFSHLLKQNLNPQTKLIIIGEQDKRYPEAINKAKSLHIEDKVVFTGYIADEELLNYFKIGDLLVLPSLYEGFGLPVVEAMASGMPVICSKVASLPEVARDCSLLVDPQDSANLSQAIYQVLFDETLRNSLVKKGLARAQDFTATKMAEEVLKHYKLKM